MKKLAIVLDDNWTILEYFATLLDVLGYEVEIYPSPVLCPLYQQDYDCDLLVTDIQMPGMTGWEFIRHLATKGRSIDNTAVISGSWDSKQKMEAEALGCKIFYKPISIDDFSSWLNTAEKQEMRMPEIS